MKKRIFTIILMIIFMLASGFPPVANATSSYITGVCQFLEEIHPPEMKMWRAGLNELHIRNKLLTMECDFSEDRLDGFYQATINWDVSEFFEPFYHVIGPDYGLMQQVDEDGNVTWQGARDMSYTPPYLFAGKVILKGFGEHAGLTARLDIWGDMQTASLMQLAGKMVEDE